MRYHVDWKTLQRHLPEMAAKTVLLTHMSANMHGCAAEGCRKAEDGDLIVF